jgi:16S rRNA (uracil1498-N3)-methyltransferase
MWRGRISTSIQQQLHTRSVSVPKLGVMRRRRSSLAVLALCYCHPITVVRSWTPAAPAQVPSRNFHSSSTTSSRPPWCLSQQHKQQQRRYLSSNSNDESTDSNNHNSQAAIQNLPRIYVETPKLAPRSILTLTPSQTNYLNVMRLSSAKRWGEWVGHLRLFNGHDGEWLAKLVVASGTMEEEAATTGKKQRRRRRDPTETAVVECVESLQAQPPTSTTHIHLYMGRLKKPRRKWVLEKATELGVSSLHAVDTDYSNAASSDAWEYDKHFAQVVEAAEQCERCTLPQLSSEPMAWDDLVTTILQNTTAAAAAQKTSPRNGDQPPQWLVCRERSPESRPILQALTNIRNSRNTTHSGGGEEQGEEDDIFIRHVNLLVGPEGGWSPREIEQLAELATQIPTTVQLVSLGSLVLRAETAAIAAVAAAMMSQEQARTD